MSQDEASLIGQELEVYEITGSLEKRLEEAGAIGKERILSDLPIEETERMYLAMKAKQTEASLPAKSSIDEFLRSLNNLR